MPLTVPRIYLSELWLPCLLKVTQSPGTRAGHLTLASQAKLLPGNLALLPLRQLSSDCFLLRVAEKADLLRRKERRDQKMEREFWKHSTLWFQAFLRLATFLLSEFTVQSHSHKINSPFLLTPARGFPLQSWISVYMLPPLDQVLRNACENSFWPPLCVYLLIIMETQSKLQNLLGFLKWCCALGLGITQHHSGREKEQEREQEPGAALVHALKAGTMTAGVLQGET